MTFVSRLQNYLRASAQTSYQSFPMSPFTMFINAHDATSYFNYAIPDHPVGGNLHESLDRLRQLCAEQGRQPRFEFIDEYAPNFATALQAAAFVQESRLQLMVCTRESYTPTPVIDGLSVVTLDSSSDVAIVKENLDTNARGFNPETALATLEDADRMRQRLDARRAFTAYLDNQPVGAGMFTTPIDGLTELVGIATLEQYRRRGVATALTSIAVETTFAHGVDMVLLTAEDARAGRVYERVGFRPVATSLAYIDRQEVTT